MREVKVEQVRNKMHWKRRCERLERENKVLFNRLKEMEAKHGKDEGTVAEEGTRGGDTGA